MAFILQTDTVKQADVRLLSRSGRGRGRQAVAYLSCIYNLTFKLSLLKHRDVHTTLNSTSSSPNDEGADVRSTAIGEGLFFRGFLATFCFSCRDSQGSNFTLRMMSSFWLSEGGKLFRQALPYAGPTLFDEVPTEGLAVESVPKATCERPDLH